MSFHRRIVLALCVVFWACQSGCGPKLHQAGGIVKVDGKPIDQGTVGFYPVELGRPSMAEVQPDGTFELSYLKPGDGCRPANTK